MIFLEKSRLNFWNRKIKSFSHSRSAKYWLRTRLKKGVNRLHTGNGLKFREGDFKLFCENEGFAWHHIVVGTLQPNGIIERINMTIMKRVRCMLSNSSLSKEFWANAASMACYLMNWSPHTSLQFTTREEVWSGNPVNYSNLKFFSCPTYAHVNQGKLKPRARKCIFWVIQLE